MRTNSFSGNVLITGGAGFLGSKLVDHFLNGGCNVRVLDISKGLLENRVDPHLELIGLGSQNGMLDSDLVHKALENIDVVCHLAIDWSGAGRSSKIRDILDVNVKGTLNLLDSSIDQGVKHFLYASSAVVYGMSSSPIADEESVCKPETWSRDPGPNYSVTKYALEKLALLYNNYQALPSTIMRIAVAFDDKKALRSGNEFRLKIPKGEPVSVEREVGRASVHAEDVARAFYLAALNERAFGQIFNVTNPSTFMTDMEVAKLMIETTHSSSKLSVNRKPKFSPPLESIKKAKRILGWTPKFGKLVLRRSLVNTSSNLASNQ